MEWWGWLTLSLSGLALLVNGAKNIEYIISPFKSIKSRVTAVETKEEKHEKEAEKQFKEIAEIQKKQEETNQMILKALFGLVNHEIDGNGIDTLKKIRDELSTNVIER